ncbi:MAG: hypothetical protein J5858_16260 [Lentisphaeria bacterium]|nr:hypothetical protein [Lentisphaeria bacterium]
MNTGKIGCSHEKSKGDRIPTNACAPEVGCWSQCSKVARFIQLPGQAGISISE